MSTMIVTAVWIDVPDDETGPQPIAAECPTCYAIVRKARLDQHNQEAHP
ncbi:MAG TPA: hypothetical protein VK942_14185 [Actinomycetes bacterium]|nr:hypothetical protein [Actinomycetes bacterium]